MIPRCRIGRTLFNVGFTVSAECIDWFDALNSNTSHGNVPNSANKTTEIAAGLVWSQCPDFEYWASMSPYCTETSLRSAKSFHAAALLLDSQSPFGARLYGNDQYAGHMD